MNLKLTSDGTPSGTRLMDTDTGKMIEARYINFRIEPDGFAEVDIGLFIDDVEVNFVNLQKKPAGFVAWLRRFFATRKVTWETCYPCSGAGGCDGLTCTQCNGAGGFWV